MKVLVIGIHIDDCEAMGGTAYLLSQKGAEVIFLNLKPYMHYKGKNETAEKQSILGASVLGAKKITFDYSGSKFYRTNEETVRKTEDLILSTKPDIIFIMHPKDNHIEHIECAKTAHEAIFAAAVSGVRPNEIYSYECGAMQTMPYFEPDFYINISGAQDAMKKSALTFNIDHANGEYLWASRKTKLKYRGEAVGLDAAEAFHIIKYPTKNNDFLIRELLKEDFRWHEHGMYLSKGKPFL